MQTGPGKTVRGLDLLGPDDGTIIYTYQVESVDQIMAGSLQRKREQMDLIFTDGGSMIGPALPDDLAELLAEGPMTIIDGLADLIAGEQALRVPLSRAPRGRLSPLAA